jgi:hypothetical protein
MATLGAIFLLDGVHIETLRQAASWVIAVMQNISVEVY